jgi:hypothetical protein
MPEQRREPSFWPAALGARDRMRGDDRRARQRDGQRPRDLGLAAADVADDRVGGQVGRELRRHRAHRTDRHAQDHQVRIDHCGAGAVGDVVADVDPIRSLAHAGVGIIAGHPHRRHRLHHAARDRRSDQAQPDDGNAREGQHQRSVSARSAAITPRVSSSVPIVMRSASGNPWPGSQRTI